MNEMHLIANTKLFSAQFGLLAEQWAYIDTDTGDGVISSSSTEHLARTAAEIKNTGIRLHA